MEQYTENKILAGIIVSVFLLLTIGIEGISAQEISIQPQNSMVSNGETFKISVTVSGESVSGVEFSLLFDNSRLTAENVEVGPFLKSAGMVLTIPSAGDSINNGKGKIELASALHSGVASGKGAVVIITFKAKSPGVVQLDLGSVTITDKNVNPISGVKVTDGYVNITGNMIPAINDSSNKPAGNANNNSDKNTNPSVGIVPYQPLPKNTPYNKSPGEANNKTSLSNDVMNDSDENKPPSVGIVPYEPPENATYNKSPGEAGNKTALSNETAGDSGGNANSNVGTGDKSQPLKNTTRKINNINEKSDDNFNTIILLSAVVAIILILLIVKRKYFD